MAAQTPAEDMKEAQEIWNKLSLGEKIGVIALPFVALFLVGGVVYWLGYPWTCSQASLEQEKAQQAWDDAFNDPKSPQHTLSLRAHDLHDSKGTAADKCY